MKGRLVYSLARITPQTSWSSKTRARSSWSTSWRCFDGTGDDIDLTCHHNTKDLETSTRYVFLHHFQLKIGFRLGTLLRLQRTVIRGDRGPPPFTLTPSTATVAEARHISWMNLNGKRGVSDYFWRSTVGIGVCRLYCFACMHTELKKVFQSSAFANMRTCEYSLIFAVISCLVCSPPSETWLVQALQILSSKLQTNPRSMIIHGHLTSFFICSSHLNFKPVDRLAFEANSSLNVPWQQEMWLASEVDLVDLLSLRRWLETHWMRSQWPFSHVDPTVSFDRKCWYSTQSDSIHLNLSWRKRNMVYIEI